MSPAAPRPGGPLPADSDELARETLLDATPDHAPAMVRSWNQLVRSAAELWAVMPSKLDKLLKIFAGRMVNISITNWGGTFVTITGDFDRAHSRFIIATQPLDQGHTLCEGIVFAPRMRNPVAKALLQPANDPARAPLL